MSACALPTANRLQLDRLVWRRSGEGNATVAFKLAAGRYTIFQRQSGCARVRFKNQKIGGFSASIGGPDFPLAVQDDMPAGDYLLAVVAPAGCGWDVQAVLNSVDPGVTPPPAIRQPTVSDAFVVSIAPDGTMEIPSAAVYALEVGAHGAAGGCAPKVVIHGPLGNSITLFSPGRLNAPGDNASAGGEYFLDRGTWHVVSTGGCPLDGPVVTRKFGHTGGGAYY